MHALLYYGVVISAALVALDLVLYVISYTTSSRLASFAARCLAGYLSLIVCAVYGVIASIALRLAGKHRLAQWTTARCFKWVMYCTTGITFKVVEGQEHLDTVRPAVIISNHQTELDVLLLGAIFPKYCSQTAKKSLKYVPVLGWFMTLSGTVFLERGGSKEQAFKAFDGAAKEMRDHRQSVFIFAEGTRSYAQKPTLLPFKKGAFHLALQAGVPIIPVVAENYSKILYVRNMTFTSGEIRVKVLPPVQTKGLTSADVEDLSRDVREKMLHTIQDMATMRDAKALSSGSEDGNAKSTGVDVKRTTS